MSQCLVLIAQYSNHSKNKQTSNGLDQVKYYLDRCKQLSNLNVFIGFIGESGE